MITKQTITEKKNMQETVAHIESVTTSKKTLLTKTLEVGSATMVSRLLGMVRVFLQARYLGVGILSDAFLAAFAIPNRLRKIFAEGALSAALIPTMVDVVKDDGMEQASRVMSLSYILFEGILIALCILIFCMASTFVYIMCPGFSPEHIAYAVPYLRILVSFIILLSSSALLTGALQAVNHFWVPAYGPVVLNVIYIAGLVAGMWYQLPVEMLCYAILFGGLVQFMLHVGMYWHLGFSFKLPDHKSVQHLKSIMIRFLPVLLSMSIMEINLTIDTAFASCLPSGSLTIIEYASRFMGIPLGVFGVAFATIMFPHFSRVIKQAPEFLGFYVREAALLIFWVMVSLSFIMIFFADKFFITLLVSSKFSMTHALTSQYVLIAFLSGLFFFSFNKILLNVYYALGANSTPTIISVIAIVLNMGFDAVGVYFFGAPGLALATTLSSSIQTMLLLYFLHSRFALDLEIRSLVTMMGRMLIHIIAVFATALLIHTCIGRILEIVCSPAIVRILQQTIAFWVWTIPLFMGAAYVLFKTRKYCGVSLYFLDE